MRGKHWYNLFALQHMNSMEHNATTPLLLMHSLLRICLFHLVVYQLTSPHLFAHGLQAVIITQALGKVPLLEGLTDAQRTKISDVVEMLPFCAGMYRLQWCTHQCWKVYVCMHVCVGLYECVDWHEMTWHDIVWHQWNARIDSVATASFTNRTMLYCTQYQGMSWLRRAQMAMYFTW